MSAILLDGKTPTQKTEQELSQRVAALKERNQGQTPILATILVGDDPASATYVKMKGNACERVGLQSLRVELSRDTTTEQLLAKIEELNADPNVHGLLVQHPAAAQLDGRFRYDDVDVSNDHRRADCLGF